MGRFLRYLTVLLCVAASGIAAAVDTCPSGSFGRYTAAEPVGLGLVPNGSIFPTLGSYQSAADSAFPTGGYCATYTSSNQSDTYAWSVNSALGTASPTAYGKACTKVSGTAGGPTEYSNPGNPSRVYNSITFSCTGTPVQQCSAGAKSTQSFNLTGYNAAAPATPCDGSCNLAPQSSSASMGAFGVCSGTSCTASTGTYITVVDYKTTAVACSSKTTGMTTGTSGQAIGTSNALQYQPGSQCGTVNGKAFCVGAVAKGACVKTTDGWGVCTTDGAVRKAPTPPGPNTGTAGIPLAPIAYVQNGDGIGGSQTTTLYDPTSVTTSTVQPPAGSASNVAGTGAPGTTDKPVTDCKTNGNCTSADGVFTATVPTDASDFGTSLTAFKSSVAGSPIGQAMSSIGAGFPSGGLLPSATFTAFNRNYTLTVPSEMVASISSVLLWVMRAVWSIIAIRRFMEA
jgi:hypothetical protein